MEFFSKKQDNFFTLKTPTNQEIHECQMEPMQKGLYYIVLANLFTFIAYAYGLSPILKKYANLRKDSELYKFFSRFYLFLILSLLLRMLYIFFLQIYYQSMPTPHYKSCCNFITVSSGIFYYILQNLSQITILIVVLYVSYHWVIQKSKFYNYTFEGQQKVEKNFIKNAKIIISAIIVGYIVSQILQIIAYIESECFTDNFEYEQENNENSQNNMGFTNLSYIIQKVLMFSINIIECYYVFKHGKSMCNIIDQIFQNEQDKEVKSNMQKLQQRYRNKVTIAIVLSILNLIDYLVKSILPLIQNNKQITSLNVYLCTVSPISAIIYQFLDLFIFEFLQIMLYFSFIKPRNEDMEQIYLKFHGIKLNQDQDQCTDDDYNDTYSYQNQDNMEEINMDDGDEEEENNQILKSKSKMHFMYDSENEDSDDDQINKKYKNINKSADSGSMNASSENSQNKFKKNKKSQNIHSSENKGNFNSNSIINTNEKLSFQNNSFQQQVHRESFNIINQKKKFLKDMEDYEESGFFDSSNSLSHSQQLFQQQNQYFNQNQSFQNPINEIIFENEDQNSNQQNQNQNLNTNNNNYNKDLQDSNGQQQSIQNSQNVNNLSFSMSNNANSKNCKSQLTINKDLIDSFSDQDSFINNQ